ncbi:MAG: hypothetical protein LIP12_00670 [Clostridiales bacterium]|nr:hypothetical protein [Clostridiales bacterium]
MSEVQDACQIVLVTGKSAYWIGKISMKITMMIMKLMNTIYLAKWKGATTLNRFRNIKGDDFMFINASTEDRGLLQRIEKEMEDHGILFARLPDLCGGDGRTQYVISPSDAAKFKAFLLDHNAGKYSDVKVGPISAEDYARTGVDRNGQETPEMQSLSRSANETLQEQRQIGMRQPAGMLTMQEDKPHAWRIFRTWRTRGETIKRPVSERTELPLTSPTVQYNLIRHDQQAIGRSDISWISKTPLKQHEKWSMYEMPDGIHTVIIPKTDQFQVATKNGVFYRAAVYNEHMYQIVNMKNGTMKLSSGYEVAEAMKKPDIWTENERLKNLAHNRNLDVEIDKNKAESREPDGTESLGYAERDIARKTETHVETEKSDMLPEASELTITGTIGDLGELGIRDTYYVVVSKDGNQEHYVEFPYTDCELSADRKTLTVQLRDDQNYDVFYNDAGSITREKINGSDLRSRYNSEAHSFVSGKDTVKNRERTESGMQLPNERTRNRKQKKNPAVKRTRPIKPHNR